VIKYTALHCEKGVRVPISPPLSRRLRLAVFRLVQSHFPGEDSGKVQSLSPSIFQFSAPQVLRCRLWQASGLKDFKEGATEANFHLPNEFTKDINSSFDESILQVPSFNFEDFFPFHLLSLFFQVKCQFLVPFCMTWGIIEFARSTRKVFLGIHRSSRLFCGSRLFFFVFFFCFVCFCCCCCCCFFFVLFFWSSSQLDSACALLECAQCVHIAPGEEEGLGVLSNGEGTG